MLINKDWKIESDDMNITIYQKGIKGEKADKPGEETWKAYGYYPTPKAALRGLLNAEVMGTGLKDFETIVAKIEEVKAIIENTNFKIEKEECELEEIEKEEYLENESEE